MQYIQKLYDKLWKSLIRPTRFPYEDNDLGETEIEFENSFAIRLDFKLKNALQEEYYLTIYLPTDENFEVIFNMQYIIYCHTHSGC